MTLPGSCLIIFCKQILCSPVCFAEKHDILEKAPTEQSEIIPGLRLYFNYSYGQDLTARLGLEECVGHVATFLNPVSLVSISVFGAEAALPRGLPLRGGHLAGLHHRGDPVGHSTSHNLHHAHHGKYWARLKGGPQVW